VDRVTVAIALGSNLGHRLGHLEWAIDQLQAVLHDLHVSSIIETEPVGVPDVQPPYLNAVAVGQAALDPSATLAFLLDLERQRGRERPRARAARTLDLDLILYGDRVIEGPGLVVPHPRFRERRFVLEPLAAIAPDLRDPVSGQTMVELLEKLEVGSQKLEEEEQQ
jgi:2-amino-4-hydroxy-6-hydroxymethyldihydropteridine diphosphokinase